MGKVVLLIAVCLFVAGCGGSKHAPASPPIQSQEWRSVVYDWADHGGVTSTHPCGAVVVAVAHMAVLEHLRTDNTTLAYRRAILDFDRYATHVCPRKSQLTKIVVGMSDADVARVAGMPRTPRLHCWLYAVTRAHEGRRVCFAHGRVTLVQRSVHL